MSYGGAQTNNNIIMHQRPSPPQYMAPSMQTFENTSNQPLLRSKAMTGYGSNNEPQPQYIYNSNAQMQWNQPNPFIRAPIMYRPIPLQSYNQFTPQNASKL